MRFIKKCQIMYIIMYGFNSIPDSLDIWTVGFSLITGIVKHYLKWLTSNIYNIDLSRKYLTLSEIKKILNF